MPEISLFCGIRITMFYSDHNPPHFQYTTIVRERKGILQLKICAAINKDKSFQFFQAAAAPIWLASR